MAKPPAPCNTPTAYGLTTTTPPSIYANWNVDVEVDGNNDADDPWDFGTNTQYPRLKYGGLDPATQVATVTSMAITSSAGSDNAYNAGDAITLRLTFSLEVAPGAGAGRAADHWRQHPPGHAARRRRRPHPGLHLPGHRRRH